MEATTPRPQLCAKGSRVWLWGAYVLFLISLGLPVHQGWNWGLGAGGSQLITTWGIQALFLGLPGNLGFIAGLLGTRSASPVVVYCGLISSIFGILEALFWLLLFLSFGATLREGFYVWLGSLIALTVWFAGFREISGSPRPPEIPSAVR